MSMNKMLFPAENPSTDFATTGGGRGWVSVNKSLEEMSEKIIKNNSTERKMSDHAIPSPIASFKEFCSKFVSGNESAVNEWRGMIAAIALQRIKSIDISIKEITLYESGNGDIPSPLASVILDCLIECGESGYKKDEDGVPNYKKLTVFCKRDNRGREIPFAMFMPSIGICPFKEYPRDLFAGLEWYDDKEGWKPFSLSEPNEQNLNITSQKLYLWLKQFDNKIYPAKSYFADFAESLKGGKTDPIPSTDKNPTSAGYKNADTSEIYQDFKTICPLHPKAPKNAYSDKILIIIPSNNRNLCLDSSINDVFVPQRKELGENVYYVLPPIHKDVVESYKNGAALNDLMVRPETDDNRIVGFTVKFRLVIDSETMTYSHFWSINDVVWTDTMPYISIWPFVKFSDDSWKKYSVSIYKSELQGIEGGRRATAYDSITGNAQRVTGIKDTSGVMPMKIDLINKNNDQIYRYSCLSEYTRDDADNVTFDMIQSESIPSALSFACNISGIDYSLGCWVIKSNSSEITSGERESVIAMDFGTTGTNVYIKKNIEDENDPGESISTLDEYILDLYNPFESEKRDYIQKYYLFGHDTGKLGKIFTYGQNFKIESRDDGSGKVSGIPNVTGRFVKIDEKFLSYHTNESIRQGLKWRASNDKLLSAKKATENFVSHILLTALLEAKCSKKAASVEIRVSYPQKGLGDVILKSIDKTYLQNISGMNISIKGETEAVCAGKYYSKIDRTKKPNISNGYAIVDIGGGTTDFSFWRGSDATSDIKNQNTFKYAGQELVEKTIMQFVKDENFTGMWIDAPKDEEQSGMTPFSVYVNSKNVKPALGEEDAKAIEKRTNALIYVLDRYKKNAEKMEAEKGYQHFLQAIRIKYYALFYLIACHIDAKCNKKEIVLHERNLSICLAGCGSKGIEFCKIGHGDFITKLEDLFRTILYEDKNANVKIYNPMCDNKEEVVKGLLYLDDIGEVDLPQKAITSSRFGKIRSKASQNASISAAVDASKTEEKAENEEDNGATVLNIPNEEEVYEEYQMLCNTIAVYEGLEQVPDDDHILNKISFENPEVQKLLSNYYDNIVAEVDRFNPDPDTYKETIALAILDAMIDEFKDNKD